MSTKPKNKAMGTINSSKQIPSKSKQQTAQVVPQKSTKRPTPPSEPSDESDSDLDALEMSSKSKRSQKSNKKSKLEESSSQSLTQLSSKSSQIGSSEDHDSDLESLYSDNDNNNTNNDSDNDDNDDDTTTSRDIYIEDIDENNYGAESTSIKTSNNDADDTDTPITFEELGLCDELLYAIKELGWTTPSIIQRQAIPLALKGHDIIGLAETGSGKTAAFALPIIQALLAQPQHNYALILAPTRELAFQISETFELLGKLIKLNVVTIIGGINEFDQARALNAKPHIIVATPGRILYHLEHTKGFSLHNLKYLVMDEADRLFNLDFEKDLNKLLEILPRNGRRSMLFSATMTSKVKKLQRASLIEPCKIEVAKKYQTAKHLIQKCLISPAKYKDCYLVYLLTEISPQSGIIFTSTCEQSQRLSIILRQLGFSALPLHGKLSQQHRLAALNRFKTGEKRLLIATDVAARGLDIPSVDLVINYCVPNHSKDYIHRVGRTARAGRSGLAITIVTQYDIELYQRIEHLLGYKLDTYTSPGLDNKVAIQVLEPRVAEAARIAAIELKEADQQGVGIHKGVIGGKPKKGGNGGGSKRR